MISLTAEFQSLVGIITKISGVPTVFWFDNPSGAKRALHIIQRECDALGDNHGRCPYMEASYALSSSGCKYYTEYPVKQEYIYKPVRQVGRRKRNEFERVPVGDTKLSINNVINIDEYNDGYYPEIDAFPFLADIEEITQKDIDEVII